MAIEVMLMDNVKKLGKAGEIVKVAPGYARNYLFPKGLAAVATAAAKRRLKQLEADGASVGSGDKANVKQIGAEREGMQLSFFQLDDPVLSQIRDEILGLDINNLTPVEALNKLNDIKKILKGK